MVHGYMKNSRSVMLAVVSANVDIAIQEILEMAKEVDTDDHRILRVLTKPDLVDKGAETSMIELIEGRRHQLTLGWHIVKNLGQSESPSSAKESFAIEDVLNSLALQRPPTASTAPHCLDGVSFARAACALVHLPC
jgi:Dynamin family